MPWPISEQGTSVDEKTMGSYLSEPVTTKHSDTGRGVGHCWATSCMQGWRVGMEDAHIAMSDLGGVCHGTSLFAVFDGHGGKEVAHFCESHMPSELRRLASEVGATSEAGGAVSSSAAPKLLRDAFHSMDDMLRQDKYRDELLGFRGRRNGNHTSSNTAKDVDAGVNDEVPHDIGTDAASRATLSLRESISQDMEKVTARGTLTKQEAKQMMMNMVLMKKAEAAAAAAQAYPSPESSQSYDYPEVPANHVGCTAVCVLLTGNEVVCANAGDSRAVLCRRGRPVALSHDHKPNTPSERARIEAAGGTVEQTPAGRSRQPMFRVNGNLNLSRSIGDLEYKRRKDLPPELQVICSTPEVMREKIIADDEFLVLACDGIWDVKSNQEVCTFIRTRIQRGQPLERTVEQLLDACITPDPKKSQGLGADNMTCIVVVLDQWRAGSDAAAPSCGCVLS